MIAIQLGLYGIKFKKGILFGKYAEYRLIVVDFLLVTIIWHNRETVALLRSALDGLAQDKDWCIKNCEQIRLHKKKATARERYQADSEVKDDLDYYRLRAEKAEARAKVLDKEVRNLESALEVKILNHSVQL
jgi:hypothetical protein